MGRRRTRAHHRVRVRPGKCRRSTGWSWSERTQDEGRQHPVRPHHYYITTLSAAELVRLARRTSSPSSRAALRCGSPLRPGQQLGLHGDRDAVEPEEQHRKASPTLRRHGVQDVHPRDDPHPASTADHATDHRVGSTDSEATAPRPNPQRSAHFGTGAPRATRRPETPRLCTQNPSPRPLESKHTPSLHTGTMPRKPMRLWVIPRSLSQENSVAAHMDATDSRARRNAI